MPKSSEYSNQLAGSGNEDGPPTTLLTKLPTTDWATDAQANVIAAYLRRLRSHRFVGGLVGTTFAVLFGIRWNQSVQLGIGDGHPLGDVLFCGLFGVMLGSWTAESYRLSEPRSTVVIASLEPRQLAVPALRLRARLVTAVSLAWAAFHLLAGFGWTPALLGISALASAGIGEATHRAIENRRRPTLSDDALTVDRHLRRSAVISSAHLQWGSALLHAGWISGKTASEITNLSPVVWTLQALIGWGGLILAVVHLRRSAPPGPYQMDSRLGLPLLLGAAIIGAAILITVATVLVRFG